MLHAMAKILVADDSDMMRKIARMSIEKGGHQVIEAHAFQVIFHPDVFIDAMKQAHTLGREVAHVEAVDVV